LKVSLEKWGFKMKANKDAEKKQKILLFVGTMLFGGAERQVVNDANMLSADNFQVTVCYCTKGPLVELLNKNVSTVNLNTTSRIVAAMRLNTVLRRGGFDAILSHMFFANTVAAIATCCLKIKTIQFEHGLGHWRKWYHIALVKLASQMASSVVTCSEASMKLRIERDGVNRKKIRVIYNSYSSKAVDLSEWKHVNDQWCDKFKILFVGRFATVKNLVVLLDTAELLRKKRDDFIFILVGSGTTENNIKELVEKRGLQEYFVFTGYVSTPEIYLSNADCFVLPSKREDLSLALIEASLFGLPSIAFDVGGNSEIIVDNKAGFIIEPYDVKDMAEKIMRLMDDPKKKVSMGKKARKHSQERFSVDRRLVNLKNVIYGVKP